MNDPSNEELACKMDEVMGDPDKLLATVYRATNDPTFIKIICMLISDEYKKDKEDVLRGIRQLRWEIEDKVQQEIMGGKL